MYFWADGLHVNVRLDQERSCILVIMGADEHGNKELVAVSDGYRESSGSHGRPGGGRPKERSDVGNPYRSGITPTVRDFRIFRAQDRGIPIYQTAGANMRVQGIDAEQ